MIDAYQTLSPLKKLQVQQKALELLAKALMLCKDDNEQLRTLKEYPRKKNPNDFDALNSLEIKKLPIKLQIILESLFVIGQAEKIFEGISSFKEHKEKVLKLLENLTPANEFYKEMGGIVGYHSTFLKLLIKGDLTSVILPKEYERPPGINLSKDSKEARQAIKDGIQTLNQLAEIYPIAGAADRLDLKHHETQEPLPAAELNFLGYTLLEGLIRDLEAREYLHFKLMHQNVQTPIVLMTSNEKNNYARIVAILKSKDWFHREASSFFFIQQPLVPMIQNNGEWDLSASLCPVFKPGGHGVLWKLMEDQGALSWLKQQKRGKALIRQINNPIAGVDCGLLALTGIGCRENKIFGFASCERFINSSEGMVVLEERKQNHHCSTLITNIEYTEFAQHGIQDVSLTKDSPYSAFPANSNILFANLEVIEKAIKKCPYPGLMINLKGKGCSQKPAGRLESTMQNIADEFITESSLPLTQLEKGNLPTFVTYNSRQKTLVATKKSYTKENGLNETPQGALAEILKNNQELLELCGFKLSPLRSEEDYLLKGPHLLFTYHPALGPLYKIISQKLRGGIFHERSECKLEIADLLIENLHLKGSLSIEAKQIVGHFDKNGNKVYSKNTGKCILKNVEVENAGLDFENSIFWKYEVKRFESLQIVIEGNGEFLAKDIIFKGNYYISVPDGYRVTAEQNGDFVEFIQEKIEAPSWEWNYHFNKENEIILALDI